MNSELTAGQGPVSGRKDKHAVASKANELIREKLGVAGSSLGEARTAVTRKVRYAAASSSGYVKDHPWKALGLATALGLIVGILSDRR